MTKLKIFLLLSLITNLTFGQKTDLRLNGLDTELENVLKVYKAVGISVTIVENNKTIYSKGFGLRDLENKLPVTASTVFPIGSITKSFRVCLETIL